MTEGTGRRIRGLLAGLAIGAIFSLPHNALAQARAPGLVPAETSVEAGLWTASANAERSAMASADLNAEPSLNAYVRDVACKVAEEYCGEVRIYVMDRPTFNASAAPNGYVEVWSGLLLRTQNEAELAFVLGHELGHYAENHSLEQWKTTKGWMTAATIVSLGAGAVGAYYAVDLSGIGDIAYLAAFSSIFSFSRGQEFEADRFGLRRLVEAGYDGNAAVNLWEALRSERLASSFPSVRRSDAMPSAFRTHPLTVERIAMLKAEVPGAGGNLSPDRFRQAIRPHLATWLDEELKRRDFGSVLAIINRLDHDDHDAGVLEFHRGEVYRLRRDEGDDIRARDAYRAATTRSDAPTAAWRELGDMELRLGDRIAAQLAYERYLAEALTADDRWIVEDSLAKLRKSPS